jgi:hypothetical protein
MDVKKASTRRSKSKVKCGFCKSNLTKIIPVVEGYGEIPPGAYKCENCKIMFYIEYGQNYDMLISIKI